MITTRIFRLLTLTALAVAATFLSSPGASGKEVAGATARDAFEKLRSLIGRWEATTSEEITATVTYELHAGGTALFETFVEAEPSGSDMVSAFHLDGDRLMLSHFCSGGNQPRMMARGLDGVGSVSSSSTRPISRVPTRGISTARSSGSWTATIS